MLEIQFTDFPLISTERLVLRRVQLDDAEAMFRLRTDKAVIEYIDRPALQSVEDALALIHKMETTFTENNGVTWILSLKDSTEMIGLIGYWSTQKENYRSEIGYMLDPAYHRQGLMQEALTAAIDFGFNTLKLHSIEAVINPGNIASVKLLERNGFNREAYFKEDHYLNGAFLDTAIYSLITPL